MQPPRPLLDGPSAWRGRDLRGREDEWSYRLSPAEIAEIEAAAGGSVIPGRHPDLRSLDQRGSAKARMPAMHLPRGAQFD